MLTLNYSARQNEVNRGKKKKRNVTTTSVFNEIKIGCHIKSCTGRRKPGMRPALSNLRICAVRPSKPPQSPTVGQRDLD